ncbi:flavodoxin family protein [Tepiditoga spiralis]|uniref:Flavodoxin family protein n=1 Tax=Tepiditoga spiralis TaxID=2108365 RepID=A0A7G1G920_9BACT|nr:flavodoxin family protein [Tepiditoga spiralis]BBE31423.1 flavodoxin family protein [Tepiditoga spiralis]
MKIIAINSSRRKGNTYRLLKNVFVELFKINIEVEIINLGDYNIHPCSGCELCIKKDICPHKDDVENIINKLKNADGVIISSPVYIENVSGTLKTLFDRLCKWYHRPTMIGKPVLIISTTAGSGLKSTMNYIEKVAVSWGMKPCGKIGRKISDKNLIKNKEIKEFISTLKNNSRNKVTLNRAIRFQIQKVVANNLLEIDKNYWAKNNLNDKDYFYDAKMGLLTKLISKQFGKFLTKKILENKEKVKNKKQTIAN